LFDPTARLNGFWQAEPVPYVPEIQELFRAAMTKVFKIAKEVALGTKQKRSVSFLRPSFKRKLKEDYRLLT
jgi:hypothetical protein